MSRQKQNPLNVGSGDVVELDRLVARGSDLTNPVTVVEFVYQFDGSHPKIVCVDNRNNGDEVDAKITRIIRRSRVRARKNIYAELVAAGDVTVEAAGHGCRQGELADLVAYELNHVSYDLPRNLNLDRMIRLFNLQKPGLLRRHAPTLVTVRRKPFGVWVRHNASRLMKTTTELKCEARAKALRAV